MIKIFMTCDEEQFGKEGYVLPYLHSTLYACIFSYVCLSCCSHVCSTNKEIIVVVAVHV